MKHIYIYELDNCNCLKEQKANIVDLLDYFMVEYSIHVLNIPKSSINGFFHNKYISSNKLSKIKQKEVYHTFLNKRINNMKLKIEYDTDVYNTSIKAYNDWIKEYERLKNDHC